MQGSRVRKVMLVMIGILVVVLAALGANSSLGKLARELPRPAATTVLPAPSGITMESQPPKEISDDIRDVEVEEATPDWLGQIGQVVGIIAVIVLVLAVFNLISSKAGDSRLRTAGKGEAAKDAVLLDEYQVAETIAEALTRIRHGMGYNDAIVECWRRLESLAAEVGVSRTATQTSREFTVEVLAATAADPTALRQLSTLYERTWYGSTRLGESSKAEAISCLKCLADSLSRDS